MRSLLLAWFASQNRSLFAARCLVEVVIGMYREGVTVDDVAVRFTVIRRGRRLPCCWLVAGAVDQPSGLPWLFTVAVWAWLHEPTARHGRVTGMWS